MPKSNFNFGDRILVYGCIGRKKEFKGSLNGRQWIRESYPEPMKGIFIKYIRLSNGFCEYENHGLEGGDYYFNPEEYIDGAWIALENKKPEKVFLSDCEKDESYAKK